MCINFHTGVVYGNLLTPDTEVVTRIIHQHQGSEANITIIQINKGISFVKFEWFPVVSITSGRAWFGMGQVVVSCDAGRFFIAAPVRFTGWGSANPA